MSIKIQKLLIPDELLNFLLVEQPVEKEQEVKQNHNLPNQTSNNDIYYIDSYDLNNLLEQLPAEYYDDRHKWLSICDVFKNMNNYEVFESYSKKSAKYNKYENLKIWNSLRGNLNINFIINVINKTISTKSKKIRYINNQI